MPIYEFMCDSCDKKFELLIGPTSKKPRCPDCGSREVRRLFSSFGFKSAGGASSFSSCSSCKATSCNSCGQ